MINLGLNDKKGDSKMTLGLRIFEPNNGFESLFINPFSSLIGVDEYLRYSVVPAVDVYEEQDKFVISAELPGLNKNEINIDFKDNFLTVSGEKKAEVKSEKENFIRTERRFGRYERRFRIPDYVDPEKIVAVYKNGILKISLPRKEESKPKKINIK